MNTPILNLLVTGASSDIGHSVVERVVSNSENRLLMTSRSPFTGERNDETRANVRHLQGIDLVNEEQTRQVAEAAREMFDGPFNWLHCAGNFWYHKPLESVPLSEAKEMISSHYVTLYATAKAVIPVMKKVGGGRVLALSCNSVRYNYPDMTAFTPAKAAVESFIRCLANEVLGDGILANCLALATIATDKVLESKPAQYHAHYTEVEKLTDAIMDCFSTMSPLVTGNTISIVKYSPYFYHVGYFERNAPKTNENQS